MVFNIYVDFLEASLFINAFILLKKVVNVQALCTVYCGELFGSNDVNMLGDVKDAILRMTYYW